MRRCRDEPDVRPGIWKLVAFWILREPPSDAVQCSAVRAVQRRTVVILLTLESKRRLPSLTLA